MYVFQKKNFDIFFCAAESMAILVYPYGSCHSVAKVDIPSGDLASHVP